MNITSDYNLINPISQLENDFTNEQNNTAASSDADKLLKEAETLAMKNTDPKAKNLVMLAATAIRNGNPEAAKKYAQKAINIIKPPEDVIINKADQNNKTVSDNATDKKSKTSHAYQDASGDVGVSFSSPQELSGPQSFLAVPSHENEHVRRKLSKAILEGRHIQVFVSYDTEYDPETGEAYLAGGKTSAIEFPTIKLVKEEKNLHLPREQKQLAQQSQQGKQGLKNKIDVYA